MSIKLEYHLSTRAKLRPTSVSKSKVLVDGEQQSESDPAGISMAVGLLGISLVGFTPDSGQGTDGQVLTEDLLIVDDPGHCGMRSQQEARRNQCVFSVNVWGQTLKYG